MPTFFHVWLTLCLLSISTLANAKSAEAYRVEANPQWVTINPDKPQPSAQAGIRIPLIDIQVRLGAGENFSRYVHLVRELKDAANLAAAGTIQIDFNPDYQRLGLHHLAIWRNGVRLNIIKSARIELVQRERGLDQDQYQGTRTLLIVAGDLRQGDILDYAYSIRGDNPVFAGRYGVREYLAASVPIDAMRLRILYPSDRKLDERFLSGSGQLVRRSLGAWTELSLVKSTVPAVIPVTGAPIWYDPVPRVMLSEYADWADVAAWASTLFKLPPEPSLKVAAHIKKILLQPGDDEAHALAALNFVQRDIRYFSILLNESSHLPAAPERTLDRRWGDCKDKSLLLTALLRGMGMDAAPVLVSAREGKLLQSQLPDVRVFDHAIVRLKLKDRLYWLDPTRTFQSGSLAQRSDQLFGVGLVIAPDTQALEPIAMAAEAGMRARTHAIYTVTAYTQDVDLALNHEFQGRMAESWRAVLNSAGRDALDADRLALISRLHPQSTHAKPIEVEDDPVTGVLKMREYFRIKALFNYDDKRLAANFEPITLIRGLALLNVTDKKAPYALPYPASFEQTMELRFPEAFNEATPKPLALANSAFRMNNKINVEGKILRADYSLQYLRDHVAGDALDRYLEDVSTANRQLSLRYNFLVARPADSDIKKLQDIQTAYAKKPDDDRASAMILAQHAFEVAWLKDIVQSGKLTPPQEARAREELGTELDMMGRFEEGRIEFERALALAPDRIETKVARASNLLYSGQYAAALQSFNEANAQQALSGLSLRHRGQSYYFLGRDGEAIADLESALGGAGDDIEAAYTRLWLHLATRRSGGKNPQSPIPEQWPAPVLAYLKGDLSAQQLLRATEDKERITQIERQCEAYYFMGQKSLLEGDIASARTLFEQAVATRAVHFSEYSFARNELAKLSTGAK